ncbi:hypothetical protein T484DRAFT_1826501 [Baffinella frigidus]|nr:hypothetical protein T484DRAFT_1826501 [Cryptophyta sp. CCMP2293]
MTNERTQVGKAIAEHPECLDLLLFQLVVLRFIFRDAKQSILVECLELLLIQVGVLRVIIRDAKQASYQQKKILDNKDIRIDRAFHLYAVIRRATQDSVSSSLGEGGSLSAVNLMEFDSRMSMARKSHQNCLSLMKKFWHLVLKTEKSGSTAYGRPSIAVIDDMVKCVTDFEVALENAKSEYRWLMEKFPNSISVVLSFAHFTDTVINDAAVLDNEDYNPDEDDHNGFMQSWRQDIVGMQFATLRALQTRVMVCVMFILIISCVGFTMIDDVLFSEAAEENVRLIDVSGLFRAFSVSSAFWMRSQMMAAHAGNAKDAAAVTARNENVMQQLMKDHADNFKKINAEDKYSHERRVARGW